MACNNGTVTLQSKEKGAVTSNILAPSSKYARSLYYSNVSLSKVLIYCSRLPIPVPNWILLGELCSQEISDPFKRLKQAMNKTYRFPYDVMMALNRRKRLGRGNGGAFENADRLYSNETCFPLNRVRYATGGISGVHGKRTIA